MRNSEKIINFAVMPTDILSCSYFLQCNNYVILFAWQKNDICLEEVWWKGYQQEGREEPTACGKATVFLGRQPSLRTVTSHSLNP